MGLRKGNLNKLEIEFHSHKKVVSPKLENSAHLFIVNFKRAKFQKNWRTVLRYFCRSFITTRIFIQEFPLNLVWVHFTTNYRIIFSTRKSCVKLSLFNFIKEFPCKLIGDLQQKFYKRIPFNFDLGSFYKEFPWKNFFTGKSFVKFFPIFKLESDFFPHFLSKIRKLENCENFPILNFKCAKLN